MASDPFKYFRIEARDLLDQIGQGVLDLEKGTPSPEHVARLLRLAHTLKGAARVVKQTAIAGHAHAVEEIVIPVRDAPRALARAEIDRLLMLVDEMAQHLASLAAPVSSAPQAANAATAPEDLFRALRPDIREMDELLGSVAEAHAQLLSLRPEARRLERARHLSELLVTHLVSPGGRDGHEQAGMIAIGRARALAEDMRAILSTLERDVTAALERSDRELRDVRSAAERLQLVSAGALFSTLERVARDTAQGLGKQVSFVGRGGAVRIEARVLAAVQGALVQAIRNAVAHGIESPSARVIARKPVIGAVRLDVQRHGRHVVFVCADDGGGVDVAAVRRTLHARGMHEPELERFTPDELCQVLLRGGISTSATVTEVSGRGVGLDVIRDAMAGLGGDASLQTTAAGTTVRLSVPVSLASFEALLVEVEGLWVSLPFDAVTSTARLGPEDVIRTSDGESIVWLGAQIPLVSLAELVGRHSATPRPSAFSVVIVSGADGLAALRIDRVGEIATVVLRPLPDLAVGAEVIAGTSMDADGSPRLVLEPDALVAAARLPLTRADHGAAVRQPVLVVDDSLTTRMLEQSILESAGYDVDLACSAEEALDKCRARRYALFLVDVEMPGMDGFTFVERTRADAELRRVPAILVTSRNSEDDRRRGAEAGANAYIVKSEFDQRILLEHIRGLVG